MQDEFSLVQRQVEKMVALFKHSKFYLSVATPMTYDEATNFNENNIIMYLSELEEYISSLMTFVAYKREDPNAAICAVPLEKLNQKEFNKKEVFIDAPFDTERDTSFAGARTELGEEEEIITDSKQLYRKFMDMVDKKQINIIHQSQAKREGQHSQMNKEGAD
mmetsp:Transcript_19657/g.14376  ORF Transcript_19657/g.14376 Transcript_19657/m.14376 type:complete len:163 (+) Transcript_19657:1032-1520(+)